MHCNEECKSDEDGTSCIIFCVNDQTVAYLVACADECSDSQIPMLCQYKCTFNLVSAGHFAQIHDSSAECVNRKQKHATDCFIQNFLEPDEKWAGYEPLEILACSKSAENSLASENCLRNITIPEGNILDDFERCNYDCDFQNSGSKCFVSCLLFEKSPQIAAYAVQNGPSEKIFACYGKCSGKLAAGQNGAICMAICLITEPSPEAKNTNLIRNLYSCSSSCSSKITIGEQISCTQNCLSKPLNFYHSPEFLRFSEICTENCEDRTKGGSGCFLECVLDFTRQNEKFPFDKDLLLSPLSYGAFL